MLIKKYLSENQCEYAKILSSFVIMINRKWKCQSIEQTIFSSGWLYTNGEKKKLWKKKFFSDILLLSAGGIQRFFIGRRDIIMYIFCAGCGLVWERVGIFNYPGYCTYIQI